MSFRTRRTGCLFFCHGARDAAWRAPFETIVARYRQACPGQPVALAFLELMQPPFALAAQELVDAGATHIHVVPLFLAPGSHTRRDLPSLVSLASQQWPQVRFTTAPTLTEDPAVREAILQSALLALADPHDCDTNHD